MGRKIFDWVITVLAIIGVFVFVGGVGKMDYMVEIGKYYSLSSTLKTLFVGVIMCLPAFARGMGVI